MKKILAVYAGTFDPLTIGHLWMIEHGAMLVDKLIVAIGTNPEKRCMFSVHDRLEMLRQSIYPFANVEINSRICAISECSRRAARHPDRKRL